MKDQDNKSDIQQEPNGKEIKQNEASVPEENKTESSGSHFMEKMKDSLPEFLKNSSINITLEGGQATLAISIVCLTALGMVIIPKLI